MVLAQSAQEPAPGRGFGVGKSEATHSVLAALAVFFATVTQAPARFVFDAANYWGGSVSLIQGYDPYLAGRLDLRGVLTSVLYVPAALASAVFGPSDGTMAVLVENSLLISFVGVLLLPWLLRSWVPVTVRTVWACAGLTWLLLGRFALAPMVDLWAAVLMIATVVLLRRRTAVKLMAAGLFAGMAFNVRPAYLLPLVLTLAVVLLSQRLAGLWFAAGTVIALMPQSLVNLTHGGNWLPLPPNLFMLTQLQAVNASYVVRYDTVRLPDRIPSQVFCSPDMAAVVDGHPPESTLALASLYLHNLPQSILFIAQKAAGSLHWPLSAPWFEPTGAADQVFALLVTTVTVLGAAALVKAQSRSGFRSVHVAVLAGAAIWWGSLITIITPSPETRFALPLVMFGIAGCALLVTRRPSRRWVAGSLTAVLVIFAVATLGLSHPAAPGPARVLKCAAA